MMLLELKSAHFWVLSNEMRGEDSNPGNVQNTWRLKWQIADELRKADEMPELKDILRVMFSMEYQTERERSERLEQIIDQLGQQVNPRYSEAIRQIDNKTMALMTEDFEEHWRRRRKMQAP